MIKWSESGGAKEAEVSWANETSFNKEIAIRITIYT
jgi:hypothetical protein